MTSTSADLELMDLHVPHSPIRGRLRRRPASRHLEAPRFATSTRNDDHHTRLKDLAFVAMLVISAIGGVLLLAA